MSLREWTLLIAAPGHAILAFLVLILSRKSDFAKIVGIMCVNMFGWTFASLGALRWGGSLWHGVDAACSALTPALVLHAVIAFIGKQRAKRRLLTLGYVAFGAMSLLSVPAFLGLTSWTWTGSAGFSVGFLCLWFSSFAIELWLLRSHFVHHPDSTERARTLTVFVALLIGGVLTSFDVLNDFGLPLPSLGSAGSLVACLLLTVLSLKYGLLSTQISPVQRTMVVVFSACTSIGYYLVFHSTNGRSEAALGLVLVGTCFSVFVLQILAAHYAQRTRLRQMARLGRMCAQLLHDLKTPLAALHGASQVLDGVDPNDREQCTAFQSLMVEQANRIRVIVDRYEQISSPSPLRSLVDLNEIVRRAADEWNRAQYRVSIETSLDPDLREMDLDASLMASALENLIRNACEASPKDGRILVETQLLPSQGILTLRVSDWGVGIEARVLERIFDDFFTTKEGGSGLGLAFVSAIARAHGGELNVSSEPKKGTQVQMHLPIAN